MPRLALARRLSLLVLVVFCLAQHAAPARADDVADEADVQFRLGGQYYERGDYQSALAHFLASNRLAKNRNVLFNIARCYERLQAYPEAHRHYTRALEGETEPAALQKIDVALARISQYVAVLKVVTNPPGARIYLDRKDLGERGTAPQSMALAPRAYRVIVELDGYEDALSEPVTAVIGKQEQVELSLKRIVGTIRVPGPPGASVRLDADNAPESCVAPCDIATAPGPHTVIVSRTGYQTVRLPVAVAANSVSSIRPDLVEESGSLVVNTDERGASIEVDGSTQGFSPGILSLPVGPHKVRVSLRGFRTIERDVTIVANRPVALDLELSSDESVEAASRIVEEADDAPASVTLITSPELSAMRYPTLLEAMRGVRGVYVSDDRGYPSLGFRGLGRPGSYGNRVLVTLDGAPLNDDWIWSSYVAYDLRTDLEDIERIEVVRGPGSVVYGTSAFSGVVNLVTRYKGVASGRELGASVAGDGVVRGRARVTQRFGDQSGFWLSAAAGHSEGRDFFFPEYVAEGPPEVGGFARGLDGSEFATLSGRLWLHDFSLSWFLHHHDKHLPAGQFETLFGDARTHQADTRGLLEARLETAIGNHISSLSRAHANLYLYRGYFAYSPEDGGIDMNRYDSTWFGAEQRFVFSPGPALSVSLGGEAQLHPNAHQRGATEVDGSYFDDEREFSLAAVYGSVDVRPVPQLKLSAGSRLDYYSTFGSSLNPRLAIILEPYAGGNIKLLAGKAFKAPSTYELYYTAVGQVTNPDLEPENIYSAELEISQRFGSTVTATASLYANYVTDLISLEDAPPSPDGTENIQFVNTDTPVGTLGAEAELRRDWKEGWMFALSYSFQRSSYLESRSLGDLLELSGSPEFREVPNAPTHLASIKGAVPLLSRALVLMNRFSYEGRRYDNHDSVTDPVAQLQTEPALIWDMVLSGTETRFGFNYSLGIYNAVNSKASYPVSTEFRQRFIPVSGRSLLASANLTF